MSHIDSVDRISPDELTQLTILPGPWVTITLPTHRSGPETRQGPLRLRNLADEALRLVAGRPDAPEGFAEELAERLEALRTNYEFWRRQAEGLVVLACPGAIRTYRTTANLPEGVRVSDVPGLHELARQVDADTPWHLVAVSQNRVALYEATGHSVTELPLEGVPASADDALGDLERQKHLQSAPQGGGESTFHGHGGGREVDRVWLEKFLRQVVAGLEAHPARIGSGPVVLAGVPAVLAALRGLWRSPALVPDVVEGNPDRVPANDLHAAALPLVVERRRTRDAELVERVGSAGARGLRDLAEVARAATEGRVGTLVLGPVPAEDAETVDTAIRDTLQHGGSVVPVADLDGPVAALARY